MRCPLCGLENLPYAEYCDCGYKLKEASAEEQRTADAFGHSIPEGYLPPNGAKYDVSVAWFSVGKAIKVLRGNFNYESKKKARGVLLRSIGIIVLFTLIVSMEVWRCSARSS